MKHPVLANRNRLLIWWLAWLFFGAGQSLLLYFAYGSHPWLSIADSLIALLTYSGTALALWYPLRYFNATHKNIIAHIANLSAMGIITVFLWIMITRNVTGLIINADNYTEFWNNTFIYRVGTGVFIYAMIILTYYLFISLANLSEKNAREARLEALVKETELKMLRSQINPHFLFNSLNSISSLTVTDPEKARTMVIKLSDFMRYGLSAKNEQTVPLAGELDNLRLYLDIEKVRFGNRLSIEEKIDNDCLQVNVPVMLLQPLYENAVKHGVFGSTGPVRINTSASITNGYLKITISNSYEEAVDERKGTGTGLINVSRRLELYYGSLATIRTSAENGMFTVSIFIPFVAGQK
jgi:hypothetical protein